MKIRSAVQKLLFARNLNISGKVCSSLNILPKVELDLEYLCDVENKSEIEANIKSRKGIGDINRVHELFAQLQAAKKESDRKVLMDRFQEEAVKIPNRSYSLLNSYGDTPKVVNLIGHKKCFTFKPKEFSSIAENLRVLRTGNLGNFAGHKSYYFMGDLCLLEHALIKFSIKRLLKRGFNLISVPDILPEHIIESCGMATRTDRTQVYRLDPSHGSNLCLSGTAEMALAGYMMNKQLLASKLPLRLAAVSRCFRAETSRLSEERGIYRVHQFTKVEMFAVTDQHSSADMLEEFREIQEESFGSLGLHLQTLDMPPHELGPPAYRKYDLEAWLPGRGIFGEVSSCSNCTDYQSRRLCIKYRPLGIASTLAHAHTVNGTACAIPRMLMALVETHQQPDGTVIVPEPLRPYMQGKEQLMREERIPLMKFMKSKRWSDKIKT